MSKKFLFFVSLYVAISILVIYLLKRTDEEAVTVEVEPKQTPPGSGDFVYDPETCLKDAKEHVFVGLGKFVLKLPYLSINSFSPVPIAEVSEILPRPDPEQSEGCPDNPVKASGVTFQYSYTPKEMDPETDGAPFVIAVHLVDFSPGAPVPRRRIENNFHFVKDKYGICEEEIENAITCRVPRKGRIVPKAEWAQIVMADPRVYQTPLARPFLIDCFPSLGPSFTQCLVSYKYSENINLFYRFLTRHIPLKHVIEIDRNLREFIKNSEIDNYPWPSLLY